MDKQHLLDGLLNEIHQEYLDTASYTHCAHISLAVENALRDIPRDHFVPNDFQEYAFANRPLPIGNNQTISQPYIVAIMTDLLQLSVKSRVLEIGTGCGYQTAILAKLAREVFSVEIIPDLQLRAELNLLTCGITNTHLRLGDGNEGWPEAAPFDAIIVTACADEVPYNLLHQLTIHGRMVIPLKLHGQQQLCTVTLDDSRQPNVQPLLPVRFVPLIRVS
jgi:protein-L-isoaspartate(D-aspartate) O-methyltransferase